MLAIVCVCMCVRVCVRNMEVHACTPSHAEDPKFRLLEGPVVEDGGQAEAQDLTRVLRGNDTIIPQTSAAEERVPLLFVLLDNRTLEIS